jgi:hypothetical protein
MAAFTEEWVDYQSRGKVSRFDGLKRKIDLRWTFCGRQSDYLLFFDTLIV